MFAMAETSKYNKVVFYIILKTNLATLSLNICIILLYNQSSSCYMSYIVEKLGNIIFRESVAVRRPSLKRLSCTQ